MERYIPLSDAVTPRLRVNVNLPFDLEERIGINTRKVHTLLQVGGVRHLKITSENGETSSSSLMVVGFNNKGEATAGSGNVDYVPTSSSKTEGFDDGLYGRIIWKNSKIILNSEEIKRRLLLKDENVKNPEGWVPELNKAISSGIWNIGRSSLLTSTSQDKVLFYSVAVLSLIPLIFHTVYQHLRDA